MSSRFGFVKVSYVSDSIIQLKEKIIPFLYKRFLGSKSFEGFGRVVWIDCSIENYQSQEHKQFKKLKIRKGLGTTYPKELQRLLISLMLHDFVHTTNHKSKIYQQIIIEVDEIREACLNHHNSINSSNPYHSIIQYYDGLASYISRRKPFKTTYRYDIGNGKIDFEQLAKELKKRQESAFKLYDFILKSQELNRLIESMNYGNNCLRNHLLLMVNLAINDRYDNKLIFILYDNDNTNVRISISTTGNGRVHSSAKDAEMHHPLTMSNANMESPFNSMTMKARNIGRRKLTGEKFE